MDYVQDFLIRAFALWGILLLTSLVLEYSIGYTLMEILLWAIEIIMFYGRNV